jgi:hypothetical protein
VSSSPPRFGISCCGYKVLQTLIQIGQSVHKVLCIGIKLFRFSTSNLRHAEKFFDFFHKVRARCYPRILWTVGQLPGFWGVFLLKCPTQISRTERTCAIRPGRPKGPKIVLSLLCWAPSPSAAPWSTLAPAPTSCWPLIRRRIHTLPTQPCTHGLPLPLGNRLPTNSQPKLSNCKDNSRSGGDPTMGDVRPRCSVGCDLQEPGHVLKEICPRGNNKCYYLFPCSARPRGTTGVSGWWGGAGGAPLPHTKECLVAMGGELTMRPARDACVFMRTPELEKAEATL